MVAARRTERPLSVNPRAIRPTVTELPRRQDGANGVSRAIRGLAGIVETGAYRATGRSSTHRESSARPPASGYSEGHG